MKNLIIGLICTMIANILLGASLSKLKEEFNWKKFFYGVFKIICIILGLVLIYIAGYYNPTMIAININGIDMTLLDALKTIFMGGMVYYAYQDLNKVIEVLKISLKLTQEDLDVENFVNQEVDDDIVEEEEPKVSDEDEITISR